MSVPKYKVTVGPAEEPVTLAELKAQLQITDSADDSYLESLIPTARQMAEDYTRRKFIEQEITCYFDQWPNYYDVWWDGIVQGSRDALSTNSNLTLPLAPLMNPEDVVISTISNGNTETVYDSSNYYVNDFDEDQFGTVELNQGSVFPGNLRRRNSIKVVYKVGWEDAAAVPEKYKQSILILSAYLYANNGECCGDCIQKAGLATAQYLGMNKIQTVMA